MKEKKVVIIGGGFAGLNLAKSLGNSKLDVVLIDKSNHHLFQPLLYQVATAALSPADIAVPIRSLLRQYNNISVMMGNVVAIDKKKKRVSFQNGDSLSFDYLVVAAGAKHSYFGNNHWEKYAPGVKTLNDALNIRERILLSFEKAERCKSKKEAQKYLNFVVIGAGPTGVEMAGAISEIAYQTMLKDFKNVNPADANVYLIEGADRVLPVYPKKLSMKAEKYLKNFGVIVKTETLVTDISKEGVKIGKELIPSSNVIWAAGNEASPLLKDLGQEMDRQGRVKVGPELSIKSSENIFVIGDSAYALDEKGNPLPGLAPVAVQQGRYLAKILKKGLKRKDRPAFKYLDKGMMATIGKSKAIGVMGPIKFSGFIAWLAWCFVHILYLIGFKNRLTVLMQWLLTYFGAKRGVRLIKLSIDQELKQKVVKKTKPKN